MRTFDLPSGRGLGKWPNTLLKAVAGSLVRNRVGGLLGLCAAAFLLIVGCAQESIDEDLEGSGAMSIQISSGAFEQRGRIPKKYTCDGADVSPPLGWSGVPEGCESLALICDDPDAPMGTWVHWVLYNLAPDTDGLPEGLPPDEELASGARQGLNDFRRIGYGGPCPPPGGPHRYFFKLYALDTQLDLPPAAKKQELLRAMEGHILDQGQLVAKYQR